MSEQLYVQGKLDNVPLSVTEYNNPLICDSVSPVAQAEEYVPYPNDNESSEESEIDEDEYHYINEDEYNTLLTFEEWEIDFERKNALAAIRLRETLTAAFDERLSDLRKSFQIGFKLMLTHIDTTIGDVFKTV